ncbi:MAG: DUF1684 domain-containing protein [Pyrinomonadaceae bacterium]
MITEKRHQRTAALIIFSALYCVNTLWLPTYSRARTDEQQSQVVKFRSEREKEFRDPKESPLEADEVTRFKGLSYFKIHPAYRVSARFTRTPDERKFGMPTSAGKTKVYVKYGELKFVLAGLEHTLGVYQSEALSQTEKYKNYLLIPFKDLTTGKETYGGGRYIDFEIPTSEQVTLDFNLAYNPSCAYSPRFNCPIPPRENRLNVKIKAGEKTYRKPSRNNAAPTS